MKRDQAAILGADHAETIFANRLVHVPRVIRSIAYATILRIGRQGVAADARLCGENGSKWTTAAVDAFTLELERRYVEHEHTATNGGRSRPEWLAVDDLATAGAMEAECYCADLAGAVGVDPDGVTFGQFMESLMAASTAVGRAMGLGGYDELGRLRTAARQAFLGRLDRMMLDLMSPEGRA